MVTTIKYISLHSSWSMYINLSENSRLPQSSFTSRMWRRGDEERKCESDKCMGRVRGSWRCIQCKEVRPKEDYAMWLAPRKFKSNNATARCDVCMRQQEDDAKAIAAKSSQSFQKRH